MEEMITVFSLLVVITLVVVTLRGREVYLAEEKSSRDDNFKFDTLVSITKKKNEEVKALTKELEVVREELETSNQLNELLQDKIRR